MIMSAGVPNEHALILHYFPWLNTRQIQQYQALDELYRYWNSRVNLISRKDVDNLYLHHVLHSMAIAQLVQFDGSHKLLDIGTGGGFPGVPLAILFPETHFVLADSIAKKIRAVDEIGRHLGLENAETYTGRVEAIPAKFDFAVCRAVTGLDTIARWMKGKINRGQLNRISNGVLALKGGDLSRELIGLPATEYALGDWFSEPFFETKKLVHIPMD